MELYVEKLRNLVAEGVAKRWGGADGRHPVPHAEIDYELGAIERYGWADYFVMAAEMAEAARSAGGMTYGRGMVGGSVVAYALGISGVNPTGIPNLLFDRLLNASSRPDDALICIDADNIGFDAAFAYLKERFGEVVHERRTNNVAPDCWIVGGRSICLTRVSQLDVISRTIRLIKETHGRAPDLDALPYDPRDVLNLVRNDDISCLSDIYGFKVPFAQKWLKRIAPQTFNELVAVLTLNQPWKEEWELAEYEDAVKGYNSAIWRHPLSREILFETRGIVLYEEQVILLLKKFARFTHEEAQKCKRYISKKSLRLFGYEERFASGCMENPEFRMDGGIMSYDDSLAEARHIWNELATMRIGGFAYPKAAFVLFARLACQIAYLATSYRAELMSVRNDISDELVRLLS